MKIVMIEEEIGMPMTKREDLMFFFYDAIGKKHPHEFDCYKDKKDKEVLEDWAVQKGQGWFLKDWPVQSGISVNGSTRAFQAKSGGSNPLSRSEQVAGVV